MKKTSKLDNAIGILIMTAAGALLGWVFALWAMA